jgi:hypothetical protein
MTADLVLDKSYLQGASPAEIHALCRSWRVIMPGALFFEYLTTTDPVLVGGAWLSPAVLGRASPVRA